MRCKTSVVVTLAFTILCLFIYLLLQNAIIKTFTPTFKNVNWESKELEYAIPNTVEFRKPEYSKISQPAIVTSPEFRDPFNEEVEIITAPAAYDDAESDLLHQILQGDEKIKDRVSDTLRGEWNKRRELWDEVAPQLLQPTSDVKLGSNVEEQKSAILEQILKSSIPQSEIPSEEPQSTQIPPIPSRTSSVKLGSDVEEQKSPILEQILKSSIPESVIPSEEPQSTPIPPIPSRISKSRFLQQEVESSSPPITLIPETLRSPNMPSKSISSLSSITYDDTTKTTLNSESLSTSTPGPKLPTHEDIPNVTLSTLSLTTEPPKKEILSVTPPPMIQVISHNVTSTISLTSGDISSAMPTSELPIKEIISSTIRPMESNLADQATYECCDSNKVNYRRNNILFLKLHKTAGGTIQNVLLRHGLRNELNFMFPSVFNYVPSHYSFTTDQLPQESRPVDGKYNILTHYIRYTPDLKNVMYPDTVTVTILRSPASVFESMYNHYLLYLQYGDLNELLKSPPAISDENGDLIPVLHGYNQMSADLGFDRSQSKNDTAIQSFIKFIDDEFDFVMIAEYFDECLVLLAHLMGWSLNEVAYLPMNRRHIQYKYNLMEPEREKLNLLNPVDSMLYQYFVKKFLECREKFGVDRLREEVKMLREINDGLEKKCVLSEHVLPLNGIIGYDLKNFGDWDCIYATKYEGMFTEEVKFRQIQRIFLNKAVRW